MRQSAAVLCRDHRSLETLRTTLEAFEIDVLKCTSNQEALEHVLAGRCTTLIVDFDLAGAEEVIRMAALLPPTQKPALLAVASRAWPGTGQAFQSGASRILYRPLDQEQLREALADSQKSPMSQRRRTTRYEAKTLIYLEFENSALPAITIDISQQGLALQAAEAVPMSSNLPFRCVLPGTDFTLHGHADVVWASDQGRAGLFFTKLTPAARKQLKQWLHKRARSKSGHKGETAEDHDSVRDLLPGEDSHVSFATSE